MTESPTRQMTVVDVYDMASVIGKDFEGLIERCGPDSVSQLMPKVISALELLETFASRNEEENQEIASLRFLIQHLENEKKEKKEERLKFEKELEQIEETYKSEINKHLDTVKKFQEENKRLSSVAHSNSTLIDANSASCEDCDNSQLLLNVTPSRRDTAHKTAIKVLQQENEQKNAEIEELQKAVERLQHNSKELIRQNRLLSQQGHTLVEEKADLMTTIQERERTISLLSIKLGETEQEKKELLSLKEENLNKYDKHEPTFSLSELRTLLQEKTDLKTRILELEEELNNLRVSADRTPSQNDKIEEFLVVYGPINKEPDEKLFPWKYERKEPGVRKFLSRFFPTTFELSMKSHNSVYTSNPTFGCCSRIELFSETEKRRIPNNVKHVEKSLESKNFLKQHESQRRFSSYSNSTSTSNIFGTFSINKATDIIVEDANNTIKIDNRLFWPTDECPVIGMDAVAECSTDNT